MTTGKILRTKRKKSGASQSQYAEKMNLSQVFVGDIERDNRPFPVERFEQFMDTYGFTKKERVDFAVHLANMNRVLPDGVRKYLKIEGRV